MAKLTQEEMTSLLEEMLAKLTLLTRDFLLDKEKKPEWESSAVTLQHQEDFAKELWALEAKPEFFEYGLQDSFLLQAIKTDLNALGRYIKEHEADIKTPRAQRQKEIYFSKNPYPNELNAVQQKINEYLGNVSNHTTYSISDADFDDVNRRVQNLLKDASKNKTERQVKNFMANLQLIKTHRAAQAAADKQIMAITAMRDMVDKYLGLLKEFYSQSKKPSSKEIGSALKDAFEQVIEDLKVFNPEIDIKSLHKADEAIKTALSQRAAQQVKSKSRNIFASADKVTLEKVLTEIKKDQPEWQKLLKQLDAPNVKPTKVNR